MSNNIQRSQGRGASYKFDRGGVPTEFGPYIGVVKNNVDPTRAGRLQVYIEQFGGKNPADKSLWRTVNYIPPFYGLTPKNNASTTAGAGSYKGNQQSYGMWFTPPDLGVSVICFFVAGDPNQGYYIGCVPDSGANHMLPAIGASKNYVAQNAEQKSLIAGAKATQLPVVEANFYNANIESNPRFFTQPKPIHSYVFAIMANQGLLGDNVRGPITSNAQRESPSTVFGISTPGRPIYQGGLDEKDIKARVASGAVNLADTKIEGRRGGHTLVMDDGDLQGEDNLIRIRTSKGHQITMSDDADCFYIIHANGSTWLEFGSEGTVDVYSSNSVNVRTQGSINLHADKDININAGENLNIRGKNIQIESQGIMGISSVEDFKIYSKAKIGILADGAVVLQGASGGWKCSGELNLQAQPINLNSGSPENVDAIKPIKEYSLDGTQFNGASGWQAEPGAIKTIVTRAPTHEPYPYHNKGVAVSVNYDGDTPSTPSPQVEAALGNAASEPVTNAVDAAAVLDTPLATANVGSLDKNQVTGLLAQAKTSVGQAANAVSTTKGIGQYGFQPAQLESAGFLKPGAGKSIQAQLSQGKSLGTILASPTLWSGKNGVVGLPAILSNPGLQNTMQQQFMSTTLTGMKAAGLVTGTEAPQQLSGLVQTATKFGVAAAGSFVKGVAPADLNKAISATIKSAQFATNFVTNKLAGLTGGSSVAESVSGTINRASIDKTLINALNDTKVPAPIFKPTDRSDNA